MWRGGDPQRFKYGLAECKGAKGDRPCLDLAWTRPGCGLDPVPSPHNRKAWGTAWGRMIWQVVLLHLYLDSNPYFPKDTFKWNTSTCSSSYSTLWQNLSAEPSFRS